MADPTAVPETSARPLWQRVPGFAWALLLYIGIAVVHYRNVLVAPTQRIFGNGDAFNRLWRIWWWAGGYKQWAGDPWFAPQIMSPLGHHLADAEISPLNMVPAVLVAKFAGPVIAYTTIGLVNLVLVGLCTYLYARSLKASRLGSAFAGALFMSAPYMTFHWVGHVPLMAAWTLPLGLLAIEKLADALSCGQARRSRWLAAGFGATLGLAGLSSGYYLVMFGIAFIVYALVRLSPKRTGLPRRPWGLFVLAAAVTLAMVVPLFVFVRLHSSVSMKWPLTRVWGAPPFAYLVPGVLHPLFAGLSASLLGHAPGEDSLYLGVVGLGLAIFGFVAWRKRSDSVRPLVWTAAVAYVLSLGPRLYLGAHGGWARLPFALPKIAIWHYNLQKIGKIGVLLPGVVLAVMPITDAIRQPDRFGVVVLVAVAALAALGFDAASDRLRPRASWAPGALFVVLLAVVLFEFATVSIYSETAVRPVETWLSQQRESGAVMWLPKPDLVEDEEIFKTTITGKPIAFGTSTFPPPQIVRLKKLLPSFPGAESVAALDAAGVRWIVWQKTIKPTPVAPGAYKKVASFADVDVLERVGKP